MCRKRLSCGFELDTRSCLISPALLTKRPSAPHEVNPKLYLNCPARIVQVSGRLRWPAVEVALESSEMFFSGDSLLVRKAPPMNTFISTPQNRFGKLLLLACMALVTFAGHCDKHKRRDPTVDLKEMRQQSVTEDLAFKGQLPFDWLTGNAPQPSGTPDEDEIAEFAERFKNTSAPDIVHKELVPGATGIVELQLAGPASLSGSAQWIGTDSALKVTLGVNGSPVATGTAFTPGGNRGGSNVHAQTPVGGRAIIAVTNTSKKKVKVRILLMATAL